MPEPIILYDIPFSVKGTSLSGNTLKTRLTLNYKGIPFKTVWLNYLQIEPTLKELSVGPTTTWPDGSPMYTLPAIYDPSTGKGLAESSAIARYLDETYPDTPRIIPEGTEAFHEALEAALFPTIFISLGSLLMPLVPQFATTTEDAEYYKAAREKQLGVPLDALSPLGSAVREQQWTASEAGLGKVAAWLDVGGREGQFFMGERVSYADIVLAALFIAIKRSVGEESEEWKRFTGWHGGRWVKLVDALEKYAV
ncbi:hypothetical protein C8Q74DRAFT_1314072 [Fomes fomentarius]|nr:hypothetical protein C8Q74DRAFT_1314072 [Fomes fomentarius]